MEMWENTAVIKISRQPPPIKIMMDKNNKRTWGISTKRFYTLI